MREQVIAKRYARALYAIGKEQEGEELKQYGTELEAITEVLKQIPELLNIFKNPIVKVKDKKALLNTVLEKLEVSQVVRNFCLFLADKKRLDNFIPIQQYYSSLLDIEQGILRGKLITAIELAKTKKDSIKKSLEDEFKKQLVLDYEKDPSILGGFVLRVGNNIYDASLKAQLDQIKENIKRGE